MTTPDSPSLTDDGDDTPAEILLGGGTANVGAVVQIGDEVARPPHPQARAVNRFLDHLRQHGMTRVPEPRGFDEAGRHRLTFIPGRAVTSPHEPWAYGDDLMIAVASLQRGLHRAAVGFDAAEPTPWASNAGDYFPAEASGDLVCHNDLCMANVIVHVDDPRKVTGFIDFDYIRPVNRLFDIAVAARHWVPFAPGDDPSVPVTAVDRLHRFGRFCDVHELDEAQRGDVVDLATSFLDHARRNVRALADGGGEGFQRLIDNGYEDRNAATTAWLNAHRAELTHTA